MPRPDRRLVVSHRARSVGRLGRCEALASVRRNWSRMMAAEAASTSASRPAHRALRWSNNARRPQMHRRAGSGHRSSAGRTRSASCVSSRAARRQGWRGTPITSASGCHSSMRAADGGEAARRPAARRRWSAAAVALPSQACCPLATPMRLACRNRNARNERCSDDTFEASAKTVIDATARATLRRARRPALSIRGVDAEQRAAPCRSVPRSACRR